MGDFKILEDPTIFGLADTEEDEEDEDDDLADGLGAGVARDPHQLRSLFDRAVGYESEFVSWALESFKAGGGRKRVRQDTLKSLGSLKAASRLARRRDTSRRRRKVGKSRFVLSRVTRRDETFSPVKNSSAEEVAVGKLSGVDGGSNTTTNGRQRVVVGSSGFGGGGLHDETTHEVVTIKQEPDVLLDEASGVMQVHEIKVEKQEECDPDVTPTLVMAATAGGGGQQQQQQPGQQRATTRNIIFQGGTNYLAQQGENTIILTSSNLQNSVKHNGPLNEKTRKLKRMLNNNVIINQCNVTESSGVSRTIL